MKVLQLNTVCDTGSTGKISASLYRLAEQNKHTSYFAYGRLNAPEEFMSYKIGNTPDFFSHVLLNFITGRNGFGSTSVTKKFLRWLDNIQPDIIHIHNLHGFYINVELLFDYIRKHQIKVIWTLHDCWPFTGNCAYFDYANCDKWQTQCEHCPIYRTEYPYSLFKDNSYANYLAKKETFSGIPNLTIVSPSQWLDGLVKQSFLNQYSSMVIPNGIDLSVFRIIPELKAKASRRIILGVANIWSNRKGLTYFLELASLLDASYHIVLIGLSKKQQHMIQRKYYNQITAFTRTANQQELVDWYNRASVYVNPTLEDNFPTTNLEALACGTPVITFNTGGSPECITDKCGIVVKKGDLTELQKTIINLETNTKITSSECRRQAEKYDQNTQFMKYIDLYD